MLYLHTEEWLTAAQRVPVPDLNFHLELGEVQNLLKGR